jgi:beta-1,4-N-acetylglucosaminyltransferase
MKMDEVAAKIDEKVIMQIGHTHYKPINSDYFVFVESSEEIEKLNRDARIVVSHAGVGSILTALNQKTPIIIVPRLKEFNEHIDDHQLEIANKLSDDQRIRVIYKIDDLEDYLNLEIKFEGEKGNKNFLRRLSDYLNSIR